MKRITFSFLFIFVLFYFYVSYKNSPETKERSISSKSGKNVLEYCKSFALKYTDNHSYAYQENSVKVTIKQPTPSTFIARYDCQFQVIDEEGTFNDIFFQIYLVEDSEFAQHVKERKLFIIPIEYVIDEINEKSGYGIFATHENSPLPEEKKAPADLQYGKSPLEYCKSFAIEYANNNSYTYQEHSASIKKKNILEQTLNYFFNAFQPEGSKFIEGYDCQFQVINDKESTSHNISIGLFLVETYAFAWHTKEEKWRIIPIEYVVDPLNKKEGYAVFKFLKKTALNFPN